MQRSPVQQRFIEDQVDNGLTRAGLSRQNPIRQTLVSEAVIVGPPGEGYLRVPGAGGELVSVHTRIEQMKVDPAFRAHFPDPPKIGRGNLDEIRDNFDAIARGDMEVMR